MDMIKVYWLSIPKSLKLEDISSCVKFLDLEEQTTYKSYKVDFKKKEFLIGRLLLKYIISKHLNLDLSDIAFQKKQYGKLYLKNVRGEETTNLDFNLTHSEGIVACALANRVVGIDVEYMKEIHLDIIKQVLSNDEMLFLQAYPKEMWKKLFYQIWTRKEAYLKAIGTGFILEPNTLNIPINDNLDSAGWGYSTTIIRDNYLLSVVTTENQGAYSSLEVQELNIYDLLTSIE
ncbi:4'-phosphopantetheinyl transferase family protein [Lysinibacillus sp. NPDC058147]|uniref:4'-phosphopantetheinyl transferase family protein n=1 Tax=unclassified Lysinibacillus TaxID=2636778 RepID=UPI0036DDEAA5